LSSAIESTMPSGTASFYNLSPVSATRFFSRNDPLLPAERLSEGRGLQCALRGRNSVSTAKKAGNILQKFGI